MAILTSKRASSHGATSGEFSSFIRTASSGEKKKVYRRVLKESVDVQDRLVKTARERRK